MAFFLSALTIGRWIPALFHIVVPDWPPARRASEPASSLSRHSGAGSRMRTPDARQNIVPPGFRVSRRQSRHNSA